MLCEWVGGRVVTESVIIAHCTCWCVLLFFSGGYENFRSQYSELCTEAKPVELSGTETEKKANTHNEKLSHHKPDYDQVKKQLKTKKKKHTHPSSSVLSTIGDQEISFYWFSIQNKHIQAILIPDRFRFEYMILPDLIAFIFGSKWEGRDASRHPIEKNTLSSLTFCLWPPFPK